MMEETVIFLPWHHGTLPRKFQISDTQLLYVFVNCKFPSKQAIAQTIHIEDMYMKYIVSHCPHYFCKNSA